MLHDLIEAEGRAGIQAIMPADPIGTAVSGLEYLFSGRSPDRPGIWLAGGITRDGHSVSGTGCSRDAALGGVAGEMAECDRRAAAGLQDAGPDWGFGAHPDPRQASAHARAEAIERFCVRRWWSGGGGAEKLERPADGRTAHPHRDLHLIRIPALADMPVVVAMSFDPGGLGCCFGAACRPQVQQAAAAALVELAQSEFGLRLARSRTGGQNPLTPPDRLTLRLAQIVHRDHIHHYVKSTPSPGPVSQANDGVGSNLGIRSLGQFADHLHVMAAQLAAPPARVFPAAGPYADLPLYQG